MQKLISTSTQIPYDSRLLGKAMERMSEFATTVEPSLKQADMVTLQQQSLKGELPSIVSINEISALSPASLTALTHAFLAAFSVILVSELGDKTFIITAIMAMKNSRFLVFMSSALALLSMTVLSVGMGVAVTVIPDIYTHYASIVLFLCFGLKMLKESYDMKDESEESEFEEVERSLEDKSKHIGDNMEDGIKDTVTSKDQSAVAQPKSNWSVAMGKTLDVAPFVIKLFTMIFVAEWGDRSQISTVVLAAREDVVGVFIGSFVGHLLCTGLAVIGGRFAADIISVKTITLIGGVIFLSFALFAIITGPD